jgi:Subtilase family
MRHQTLSLAGHPVVFSKRCLCLILIINTLFVVPLFCLQHSRSTPASMLFSNIEWRDDAASSLKPATGYQQNETDEPKESKTYLTFRAGPEIGSDALELITKMTDPRTVKVSAHQSLEEVMRFAYGDFRSQIVDLVKAANPGFPDAGLEVEGSIQLPAGPYFLRDVKVKVPEESSLASLGEILLGTEDVKSIQKINNVPKGGWTNLKPGATVNLPYLSRFVTYPVRSDVTSGAATTLIAVLKERAGITEAFVGSPEMVQPVGMASVSGVCAGVPATNRTWYQDVLGVASADLLRLAGETQSLIAFLDTGLGATDSEEGPATGAEMDPRFSYWTNRQEAVQITTGDDDGDGYSNDVHGVDVAAKGELLTEPVNKQKPHLAAADNDCRITINATHGTHVAGILSGNVFDGPLRQLMAKRIQLLPVKVTNDEAALRDQDIQEGLNFLKLKHSEPFRVVNLSFVDAAASINTYRLIDELDDKLFVVAAGNASPDYFSGEQVNLDRFDRRVFPARLGALKRNVVTVAALNESRALAGFSYYGRNTVDLAAPGESILSTVRDFDFPSNPVATGFASGTSQAAPFVSMTAALLFMMGLNDVGLVRRRLISSTDFNPKLRDYVWSSGSLNIAKALSVYDDFVQLKSTTNQPPIKGIISRPLNISAVLPGVDGAPGVQVTYPIEQVRKIIPEYQRDSEGKVWSALIISAEELDDDLRPFRTLIFVRCELNISSIEILKDLGDHLDTNPTLVSWQDIEDVVICDPPNPLTRKQRAKLIGGTDETQLKFWPQPTKDIR